MDCGLCCFKFLPDICLFKFVSTIAYLLFLSSQLNLSFWSDNKMPHFCLLFKWPALNNMLEHFPIMIAFKISSVLWATVYPCHFPPGVLRLDERYLCGMKGWCCSAPTASPLGALIKVKEAGLICMADRGPYLLYIVLYRGAGEAWLREPEMIERQREKKYYFQ